jgi:hypothetical protein
MFKGLFSSIVFLISLKINAQLATLTTGGDYTSEMGTFSFSVGESICVFENNLTSNTVQAGVQQTQTMYLVEYIPKVEKLLLYPNPAIAKVDIDISTGAEDEQELHYTIYSYDGKQCKKGFLLNNFSNSIEISDLSAGKYLIVIDEFKNDQLSFIKME